MRLRLHPLLGEFAAQKANIVLKTSEREAVKKALFTFWREYGQRYPNYEGLSWLEAENVWKINQVLSDEATRQQTTSGMLSLSAHANELLRLGFYIGEHGEPQRGRAYIMESFAVCQAMKDTKGIGKCYLCLAFFDEDSGNYLDAITHYSQALQCFEQVRSPETRAMHEGLKQLLKYASKEINRSTPDRNQIHTNLRQLLSTEIGKARIIVPSALPSLGKDLHAHIRIEKGENARRSYNLSDDMPFRIGRALDADLFMEDLSVSRVHATIYPEVSISENKVFYCLIDNGSRGGTLLNGALINQHQPYRLHSGDTIHIGTTIFRFTQFF
ncbi:MAG TPA: FHA domain-containing protein [Ktedonobacteraceae bacterium]|nr:FHA domain-containing protein [Ktedonobacteraceae bacterium]